MKTLFLGVLLTAWCLAARPQGTVNFINVTVPVGLNAPVYHSDGVTPLSGPQFQAELLGGLSASNMVSIATTGFLQGNGAGYFNGGEQTITAVPGGGIAWVQVEVWNTASGASFSQTRASALPDSWWESAAFTVVTGRDGVNPTLPAFLLGLGDAPVFLNSVPEPSTFALIGLGSAAALLHIRRRKRFSVLLGKSGWK
ncbi:MAG TPA: PEP-CTERM sorting domain-containing protein [Candidatus Acidoferrum sp.]|jgi:hypothetical protein|nr:PEP-CTERM sorting domain-containing protein [Candidatus Acidoferrum sp.]